MRTYRRASGDPGRLLPFVTVLLSVGGLVGICGIAHGTTGRVIFAPTGPAPFDIIGVSVASADLNGDGYPDAIAGGYDADFSSPGHVYIYFGGPAADAVPDLTLTGAVNGDAFGYSVGSTGDVNGDGYTDLIVGAPINDAGGTDAGGAYVYFGGSFMDATVDLILTGAAAGDNLGASVGAAGDVNQDGYADVVVGAPWNDAGGLDAGRAYVFFGGSIPDAVADLVLTGATAGDLFGRSAATAGDANGDGYADLIIGAPNNDVYGIDAGTAYLYYGGNPPNATSDATFLASVPGDNFGHSVSTAGDMNGDGFSDIVIGSPFSANGAGRVFVYYGGTNQLTQAALVFPGTGEEYFGISLAEAGDVNGDGFSDVIVGASNSTVGGTPLYIGRAYVYFGGPNADETSDLTLTGASPFDYFGTDVAGGGDFDGDGHVDLIVGSPQNDMGGAEAGRVYVYSARPYKILAPLAGDQWVAGQPVRVRWLGRDLADISISLDGGFTWTVASLSVGGGDDNEVTVPAPGPDTQLALVRISAHNEWITDLSSEISGAFRVVAPVRAPASAFRFKWIATGAATDQLGYSVAATGDFNGDGYADVIAGAPFSDPSGLTDAGRAYLHYGGQTSDATPDLTLTGLVAGDAFGASVASVGDFNGDAYPDVIVGAPANDAAGSNAGRAYLYYGGPAADAAPDVIFTGSTANDLLGSSVAGIGDVNGDGFDDVAVGAPYFDINGTDGGRVYVYYGGIAPNNVADVIVNGAAANDQFGTAIAGGDVNGDGLSDLIVSAPNHGAGALTFAGAVYVYFGGITMDVAADLSFLGPIRSATMGSSLAAGDLDNDGKADILIEGGTDANLVGRAYLVSGSAQARLADATVYLGTGINEAFASSVALGDVNGDGYADAVIGAAANDAGGTQAGKVYVFYGGPGVDNLSDLEIRGSGGSQYGISVAVVANLLGDGIGVDVLVGARGASAGAGRIYAYDFGRYWVTAPIGGETWQVGAMKEVRWSGAEPANVWLSVDGGNHYDLVRSDVGGSPDNTLALRVPHLPTKFARIRVTPTDASVPGLDETDSLFTIQVSVALLSMLAAPALEGRPGAVISWESDPGPADLAGYRLERAPGDGSGYATIVPLTRDLSYEDATARPGARYRLFAVNGFGEELLLGEATFAPRVTLAAWPLPFRRGGTLSISYTAGAAAAAAGVPEVAIFDVRGRLVRRIAGDGARGGADAGSASRLVSWNGRDERGREVGAGVYFLKLRGPSEERVLKVVVLR